MEDTFARERGTGKVMKAIRKLKTNLFRLKRGEGSSRDK
jgi:hypothetical protein